MGGFGSLKLVLCSEVISIVSSSWRVHSLLEVPLHLHACLCLIILAMDDILSHPDTTLEIGISAIRETHKNGRHDLAINALCLLKQKTKFLLDKETLEQVHLVCIIRRSYYNNLYEVFVIGTVTGE